MPRAIATDGQSLKTQNRTKKLLLGSRLGDRVDCFGCCIGKLQSNKKDLNKIIKSELQALLVVESYLTRISVDVDFLLTDNCFYQKEFSL